MKKSFTLIELMMVIVIISILLAMGVWSLVAVRQNRSLPTIADNIVGFIKETRGYAVSPPQYLRTYCYPQNRSITSAVIDQANGFAYFGTDSSENPSKIYKVKLSDFSVVGSITLNSNEYGLNAAVLDPVNGYAYFSTTYDPGKIVKIRLSDFKEVASINLALGEVSPSSAVIDLRNPNQPFGYFGTGELGTNPADIIKVNLSPSTFTRVGKITLNSDEINLTSAVIDQTNGFAYFGTGWASSNPGKIIKIRLSDFSRQETLTLNLGEFGLSSAVIDQSDPTRPIAYFGTNTASYDTSPAKIIQVDLSPTNFSRIASITLDEGERYAYSAVIDQDAHYAYFGVSGASGKIIKIKLPDFTRADTASLYDNENAAWTGVLDKINNNAYFATLSKPSDFSYQIAQINLNTFTETVSKTLGLHSNVQNYMLKNLSVALINGPIAVMNQPFGTFTTNVVVIDNCGRNDGNVATGSNYIIKDLINDPIILPANVKFVDENGTPVNYKISIVSADPDLNKIGNIVISQVDAFMRVLKDSLGNPLTNLPMARMTDGTSYYDLIISPQGTITVKKE